MVLAVGAALDSLALDILGQLSNQELGNILLCCWGPVERVTVEAVLALALASALMYALRMRIADSALLVLSLFTSGMGIADVA